MDNDIPEPFEASLQIYLSDALQMQVFPGRVPQRATEVYPRITYTVELGTSDLIMSGPSGLAYKTIQFDCWAQKDLDSCTIRDALKYALSGYRGMMGSTFITNSVFRELPAGDWEKGVDGQDSGTFRKTVECVFAYREYVPRFPSVVPAPEPPPPVTVDWWLALDLKPMESPM